MDIPKAKGGDQDAAVSDNADIPPLSSSPAEHDDNLSSPSLHPTTPGSPNWSRNDSFSNGGSYQDDWESIPPLDRISMLDILDNFALPQQLEKIQKGISAQTQKVRKSRDAFKNKSQHAKERMVEEWRRRAPTAEEQLDRYRTRMRQGIDKLGSRWNDTKVIGLREKISFIFASLNIFASGYLIAGHPEWFHVWYTVQLFYFMPIRFFTYRKQGMHYFLVDLCYFVNFLLALSLWVFPGSKRLFLSAYCLAMGNNAVAIVMWRNSLVYHSFDKVTSLFIHILPCTVLHVIVHLWPDHMLLERFPAVYTLKNSPDGSSTDYRNIVSMTMWSSVPYALWQLSYYFFITVRRREKIRAGRPTSFTWLRKSYSKTYIGQFVLSLPDILQEPAFMLIQYSYAVMTMIPCPLWFNSRLASSCFLLVVFTWSIYNGSTFYIDVFGKRFQKELDALKAEVAQWQASPSLHSPLVTPNPEGPVATEMTTAAVTGTKAQYNKDEQAASSVDQIPLLNDEVASSGVDGGDKDVVRERKLAAEPPMPIEDLEREG